MRTPPQAFLKPASTKRMVLAEEAPLRQTGPFIEPMAYPPPLEADPPRALRALARIIDGGLCHRCGSCIGICPTGVLSVDEEEYPKVSHLSACTDCNLCVRVCPGEEFDFRSVHQKCFAVPANLLATHGYFLRGAVAHANNPYIRQNSTSGGLVTAILLHLLETGQIDGAVVVVPEKNRLWKGTPVLARSREEILAAMKPKYALCATNTAYAEICKTAGRYAVVGLPCQIHGFHKAVALDRRIRTRVVLKIGLFCHAAIEHEAFQVVWDSLGEKRQQAKRFISRVGKHPGTPHVELSDGSLYPVYFGQRQKGYRPTSTEVLNVLYRLYTPERCMTCFDGLSDFADISVGDPWLPPPADHVNWYDGWSFALIRSKAGQAVYEELLKADKISAVELTCEQTLSSNKIMAHEKRWRAWRMIERRRRRGRPVPLYGDQSLEFPKPGLWRAIRTELHMLTHFLCFQPRLRAAVLRFFLSPRCYWLFYFNSKRRAARVYLRDFLARLERKLLSI